MVVASPAGSPPEPSPRARLQQVAGSVTPVVRAADRVLAVSGPAGALLPGGGLRRGSVVVIGGAPGGGATSVALELAAAAGAAEEWAFTVELAPGPGGAGPHRGVLGGLAAVEAGVGPDRFAVVRGVTRERWSAVVAALLDCGGVVAAETPRGLRPAVAGRLAARARQQGAVLVALGEWPVGATRRLRASGRVAAGSDGTGGGAVVPGAVRVRVDGPDAGVAGAGGPGGRSERVAAAG